MKGSRVYHRRADAEVTELTALFYEAIHRPELWVEVVCRMGAMFSCTLTGLTTFESGRGESITQNDPYYLRLYNEHYGALDPHAARIPANPPEGLCETAESIVSLHELERTEYYNGFLKPQGAHYGAGLVLRSHPAGLEVIGLFRGKRHGEFSRRELDLLRRLQTHLGPARATYARMRMLEGAMAALSHALVTCDGHGRVLFANQAAVEDLEQGGILRIARGGVLSPCGGTKRQLWEAALRAAAAGRAASVPVNRAWPLRPVVVDLVAAPGRGTASMVVASWQARAGERREDLPALRCAGFGLTAAETRVALAIAEGRDTNRIAQDLGVQPNTVRVHLKHVYAKTGTAGRADLARLIYSVESASGILRVRR